LISPGFTWLSCHLVKSRARSRIRRNLNDILDFNVADAFFEIGFARRILADFAESTGDFLVFLRAVRIAWAA